MLVSGAPGPKLLLLFLQPEALDLSLQLQAHPAAQHEVDALGAFAPFAQFWP